VPLIARLKTGQILDKAQHCIRAAVSNGFLKSETDNVNLVNAYTLLSKTGTEVSFCFLLPCISGSQPFLMMYPLSNILSIKYPFTIIMSKLILYVPVIVLLRKNLIMKILKKFVYTLRYTNFSSVLRVSPFKNHM